MHIDVFDIHVHVQLHQALAVISVIRTVRLFTRKTHSTTRMKYGYRQLIVCRHM